MDNLVLESKLVVLWIRFMKRIRIEKKINKNRPNFQDYYIFFLRSNIFCLICINNKLINNTQKIMVLSIIFFWGKKNSVPDLFFHRVDPIKMKRAAEMRELNLLFIIYIYWNKPLSCRMRRMIYKTIMMTSVKMLVSGLEKGRRV